MTICLVQWPRHKWGTQALKAVYKIVISTLSKTYITVVMIWAFSLDHIIMINSSLMDQTVIISASSYTEKNLFQAPSIIKCGVYHVRFFTGQVKFIMSGSHFGEFSKRLSDFKHSYLSQMTTKNDNQYIKI